MCSLDDDILLVHFCYECIYLRYIKKYFFHTILFCCFILSFYLLVSFGIHFLFLLLFRESEYFFANCTEDVMLIYQRLQINGFDYMNVHISIHCAENEQKYANTLLGNSEKPSESIQNILECILYVSGLTLTLICMDT